MEQKYPYAYIQQSAEYVLSKIDFTPEIGLVLGTALGSLADDMEGRVEIEYADIPNFLVSTVESHAGKLLLGTLYGKKVAIMSGRFHYYEGYEFEQLVLPVRLFKLLGADKLILTNAAGAVNESYQPGDIVVIKDHIKLMGASPLRGMNVPEFGPRFNDVTDMYSRELRAAAHRAAKRADMELAEGIYYYWMGPHFETPAEIRAIRILGADAVGMSTAPEAIVAAHCGMKLLTLSLMTNMAAGILEDPLSGHEISATAAKAVPRFKKLLREIIKEI